jgi:acyl dehydratase
MPFNYTHLMALKARDERFSYSERDALLYALAVGFGADPLNPAELAFVYEGLGPRVVPTFANTLAFSEFLLDCGWERSRLVHAGESLTVHRQLRHAGSILLDSDVVSAHDRGVDNGAIVTWESRARDARDNEPMFTIQRTFVALGDGGFGGPPGNGPAAHPIPTRAPDLVARSPTRPDQALLYRLCGDLNPLHADPAAAKRAGLRAPILHGLGVFGVVCRAVIQTICEYDPALLKVFEARFTAPVYPGDTLRTEMWQHANVVSFRTSVVERDTVVVDHGRCVLAV